MEIDWANTKTGPSAAPLNNDHVNELASLLVDVCNGRPDIAPLDQLLACINLLADMVMTYGEEDRKMIVDAIINEAIPQAMDAALKHPLAQRQ